MMNSDDLDAMAKAFSGNELHIGFYEDVDAAQYTVDIPTLLHDHDQRAIAAYLMRAAEVIALAKDGLRWRDNPYRISILRKAIDLALATDPDASLKHIVGVVEALFGEKAGPIIDGQPTIRRPVYNYAADAERAAQNGVWVSRGAVPDNEESK